MVMPDRPRRPWSLIAGEIRRPLGGSSHGGWPPLVRDGCPPPVGGVNYMGCSSRNVGMHASRSPAGGALEQTGELPIGA